MKKYNPLYFVQLLLFVLIVINLCYLSIFAQNITSQEIKISSPSEEIFKEADSLLAPWRNSGCHNTKGLIQEPNCHKITPKEWQDSSVLTLYNEDGSQWYQFSIEPENPQHFQRNTTIGFLPFATWLAGEAPILRLVGESKNWYKVEVNEKTQAIKYALKNDSKWAKTTWDYWLIAARLLVFTNEEQSLLDKPEGNIINEAQNVHFWGLKYLKMEGDWLYVEGVQDNIFRGWIRWRKEREILVSSNIPVFQITKIEK